MLITLIDVLNWLLNNRIQGVSTNDSRPSIESALGPATDDMLNPPANMAVRLHGDIEVAYQDDRVMYIQVDVSPNHLKEWKASLPTIPTTHPQYLLAVALSSGRKDSIEEALRTVGLTFEATKPPEEGICLQSGARLYWGYEEELSCIMSVPIA